jgi:hypothetical protein
MTVFLSSDTVINPNCITSHEPMERAACGWTSLAMYRANPERTPLERSGIPKNPELQKASPPEIPK